MDKLLITKARKTFGQRFIDFALNYREMGYIPKKYRFYVMVSELELIIKLLKQVDVIHKPKKKDMI